MIKQMKGWKVIYCNDQGILLSRTSARIWEDKWCVKYPPGIEVFPNVKGSKLFFFKNIEDATAFQKRHEIIIPCIAKNVTKARWAAMFIETASDFWNKRSKSENKCLAPKGTYLAESITCLK